MLSSVFVRTKAVSVSGGIVRGPNLEGSTEAIGRCIAAFTPVPRITDRRVVGSM
jgi:hypothetical protein